MNFISGRSSFETALLIAQAFHATHVKISVYKYVPNSLEDERTEYRLSTESALDEFHKLEKTLRRGEDIAFHSLIRVDVEKLRADGYLIRAETRKAVYRHIPLVDCAGTDKSVIKKNITRIMTELNFKKADIYFSGKSYHVYIHGIQTRHEWAKFMGRLLLINERDTPETVDSRWIGHRLLAGYAALRVTNNGKGYARPPDKVDSIEIGDFNR